MANVLEFRPTVPNSRRPIVQPIVPSISPAQKAALHAQRETQIAATVARNERQIARLLSIDHLNRIQRLFATAPTSRTAR